jgi:hypothetical protein
MTARYTCQIKYPLKIILRCASCSLYFMQESIRWSRQQYVVRVHADSWSYSYRLDIEVILVWSFSEVNILPCKNYHQFYKLTNIHTLMHTLNNDVQEGANFCIKWNWWLVPWPIHKMSWKLRLDMWYIYNATTGNSKISVNSADYIICCWKNLIHSWHQVHEHH